MAGRVRRRVVDHGALLPGAPFSHVAATFPAGTPRTTSGAAGAGGAGHSPEDRSGRIEVVTPTLYVLCGLPGSGKSTRAKELEAAGEGILLNADGWVWHLYPDDAEAAARDERKDLVEQVQWELAERLLTGGTSVILDWGVWTRAERALYRRRARDLGATVQTVFVDAPIETIQARVAQRNRALPPGTFRISADELDQWASIFEPPTHEELAEH